VAAFKTKHTHLHKRDLDAQMKNLPNKRKKINGAEKISGRGRIQVDFGNHQLKICSPILFAPVLHDHTIITRFTDENSTLVLQDVAEVMKIFEGSRIMVEGHTRTPDDLLDNWAFKLANARADFIKKTISDHGIREEQIDTSGLPGKHGIGQPAIKLRMLSYTDDHEVGEDSDSM